MVIANQAGKLSVLNCLNLSGRGKEISLFHVEYNENANVEKLNIWSWVM